jgi:Fe-S-cluster-containing hydrogenase component 2/CRP-like cAMP-binding protein
MANVQVSKSDGLVGEWLSLEEINQLDFFQSKKRAFKVKLATNFAPAAGEREPGIKAAVRREYQKGDVICKAGDFGSTAFLILEGRATASLPETATGSEVRGRSRGSIARLAGLFRRRSQSALRKAPPEFAVGELSPYASLSCDRPPPPASLGPGDFFGIDTCVNFYPREATVQAEERCVVLEMLRSVLDSIRDAGEAGSRVDGAYEQSAIRNELHFSPLFRSLGGASIDVLAAGSTILTPDSDDIKDGVIYSEDDPAEDVYLVRAGTIKLSRKRDAAEFIFSYLGRGSVFGLENVVPSHKSVPLVLRCVSHPTEFPEKEVRGSLTLGRARNCDIAFAPDNRAVSKRHCKLEERDGEVYLVDNDSVNYTLLNGERIKEAIVNAGDRITIVDFTFEQVRAAIDPTAAGARLPRLATATGLDNFEVVRISGKELRRLALDDPRLLDTLVAVARGVESTAAVPLPADPTIVGPLVELNLYNSQNTLLIDLDRCTRCDECVRACSDAHGGIARFTRDGPRFGKYLVTTACRSCTDPKCMIGCPVGSIRRHSSLELRIEEWCIGCQKCANQCPFGNINMVEVTARGLLPMAEPATLPMVQEEEKVKLRATVCDLCAGYDGPSCVYACPHDAAIRVNPSAFLSSADLR